MRFAMPHYPCDFEIPDEWLDGFPLNDRRAPGHGYHPAGAATLVPLADIQPPRRNLSAPKDWHGLCRDRFLHVLRRMVEGLEIDPVKLHPVPPLDWSTELYPFVVENGMHRYYASIVAGFDHLSAAILKG